jgi:hypothetical protein
VRELRAAHLNLHATASLPGAYRLTAPKPVTVAVGGQRHRIPNTPTQVIDIENFF